MPKSKIQYKSDDVSKVIDRGSEEWFCLRTRFFYPSTNSHKAMEQAAQKKQALCQSSFYSEHFGKFHRCETVDYLVGSVRVPEPMYVTDYSSVTRQSGDWIACDLFTPRINELNKVSESAEVVGGEVPRCKAKLV